MRRLGPTLVLALTFTTLACSGYVADTSVAPGDRVRVTAPSIDLDKRVGTVAALETDTLVVEVEERADALALPLSGVKKLEVHRGQKGKAGEGALIGLAFGTANMLALWATDSCDDCGGFYLLAISSGAALGAGLGALIGSQIRVDRWENVPLDEFRVGRSPVTPDGVAVSVALRF